MILIADGGELKYDINRLPFKRGSANEIWIRKAEVLEKIEKHTLGYLCDRCFAKDEEKNPC